MLHVGSPSISILIGAIVTHISLSLYSHQAEARTYPFLGGYVFSSREDYDLAIEVMEDTFLCNDRTAISKTTPILEPLLDNLSSLSQDTKNLARSVTDNQEHYINEYNRLIRKSVETFNKTVPAEYHLTPPPPASFLYFALPQFQKTWSILETELETKLRKSKTSANKNEIKQNFKPIREFIKRLDNGFYEFSKAAVKTQLTNRTITSPVEEIKLLKLFGDKDHRSISPGFDMSSHFFTETANSAAKQERIPPEFIVAIMSSESSAWSYAEKYIEPLAMTATKEGSIGAAQITLYTSQRYGAIPWRASGVEAVSGLFSDKNNALATARILRGTADFFSNVTILKELKAASVTIERLPKVERTYDRISALFPSLTEKMRKQYRMPSPMNEREKNLFARFIGEDLVMARGLLELFEEKSLRTLAKEPQFWSVTTKDGRRLSKVGLNNLIAGQWNYYSPPRSFEELEIEGPYSSSLFAAALDESGYFNAQIACSHRLRVCN